MKVQRSNVLAFGPAPVAWLCIPLTQARAAAIVQFEESAGIPILDALIDALDDIVFDIGPTGSQGGNPDRRSVHAQGDTGASEFASEGQVTCVQPTRSESEKPDKSSAAYCGAPQEIAGHRPSAPAGRSYTRRRSRPPKNSPPQLDAASAPPNTSLAASSTRPVNQSSQSINSWSRLGGEADNCGND